MYVDLYMMKNIFSNEIRTKIIEDCQSFLYTEKQLQQILHNKNSYPGKQTLPYLHEKFQFKPIVDHLVDQVKKKSNLNLEIDGSWINLTNGKKKDISWHHHSADYSLVYYIKTFPFFSNGTLFKNKFIKAPQNSLLVFPGRLEHTAPSSPLPFDRYTLAMDLNIK